MGWYSGINREGIGTGQVLSQVANNTFHSVGGMGWTGSMMAGAGIGAGVGAVNGGLSYDGTVMGGAFRGAALGAVGGAAFRLAGDTYRKGETTMNSAFTWGAFGKGWNRT